MASRPSHLSRSLGRVCTVLLLIALILPAVHSAHAQAPIRIMFLHHSTGHNLIEEGGVREGFRSLGYEFYDHGYNGDGLRLTDGSYTGTNFDVPDDNTDPDGYYTIFNQPLHEPPDNTFSYLMQYDVIVFKSCFPTSNIWDDARLGEYQSWYLSIRDRMDQYPGKLFIVVTPPPQVPGDSNPEEAARARAFADWLASDEYLAGHPNVYTFDFFDLLAGDDNFLRREYRTGPHDAHPNQRANSAIGPQFVAFIDEAIHSYDIETMRGVTVEPVAAEAMAESAPAPVGVEAAVSGLVEGFEALAEPWYANSDQPASVIECGGDSGFANSGSSSLRIHYDIAPGGWVDCGVNYEATQDWGGGTGLSMWVLADTPGQPVTLMLYSGEADSATPFEAYFETTPGSVDGWTQVAFPWSDFARAQWADAGGLTQVDPARVLGYGFSLGADAGSQGILWVDDLGLMAEGGAAPLGVAPSDQDQPAQPIEAGEEAPADRRNGLCPLAMVLPLAALGAVVVITRRR